MRWLSLLPLLALAACKDTGEDAKSIAYEGRSALTVPLETEAPAGADAADAADVGDAGAQARVLPNPPPTLPRFPAAAPLDGRYGASAADCDPGNRYMTEFLEIDGQVLTYRGEPRTIAVREDALVLGGGERIERRGDRLVRWPDQRNRRTVYTRCRA